MWRYLQQHEAFVRRALEAPREPAAWLQLREFHARQVAWMQHERLIHLLVLLAVCLLFALSVGYLTAAPSPWSFAFAGLLLALLAAYLVHYFRLENGVQRWYHLANRLDEKCGLVSAQYEPRPG